MPFPPDVVRSPQRLQGLPGAYDFLIAPPADSWRHLDKPIEQAPHHSFALLAAKLHTQQLVGTPLSLSFSTTASQPNSPVSAFSPAGASPGVPPGTMDGLNECRTARVAEVLSDFRTLQYYIAAAPVEPDNVEDYFTEGWATLRQCSLDGQFILECAADTKVPNAYGEDEQMKAELKQVLLDAYSRRHEGQKIYLRQEAAQRWIDLRQQILQGQRPYPAVQSQLLACDEQFHVDMSAITDELVYGQLLSIDRTSGRWTVEDPSLRSVLRWLRTRR